MQPRRPAPATPHLLALAALALVLAPGCPHAQPCDTAADCDDGNADTTDSCGEEGVCAHAPLCSGEECKRNPCSTAYVAEGGLKVAVLDVGQGDAIAIVAPSGCAAVVDGGPTFSGATIRSWLRTQGVTSVDFAVASHYHADHLGGLDELEEGSDPLPVAMAYDRGRASLPSDSSSYDQYAATFEGRRRQVAVGDSWNLCEEVCFQVLAANANGESTTDENARSVVLRLRYGAFTMLLGGDLTSSMESSIGSRAGKVDVYKVHHHGSATSSTNGFLSDIRPTTSLISVGFDNSFGHPATSTMNRLADVDSAVWRTEDSTKSLGNIVIAVDSATTFTVSQGTGKAEYTVKGR
ncbi:MAG: MBL fold metallo-hydrolase [Myxococcales bacterium]